MPNSKWFRIGYGVALLLLIIYLASLVDFIFSPIVIIFKTLFPVIIIGGVLYYLCRPLVELLSRKMPRSLSILCIYIAILLLIALTVIMVGPTLQNQVEKLIDNTPGIVNDVRQMIEDLQQQPWAAFLQQNENFNMDSISSYISDKLQNTLSTIGANIAGILGFLTSTVVIIVVVPFVLYYLLKEGSKLPKQVLRFLPSRHEQEGRNILNDMDTAISSYIQGQAIVSFCVGVLLYIAYLIIGLEYSLILALVAMVMNVVPVIGPLLGTAPAVIVGFLDAPLTALWVVIAILVVQQIEGNFISPQVMGRKLSVHPLTIILLLLVASNIAGLLGLILAVPFYAVAKVIVNHTYRLIRLRIEERK